MRNIQSRLVAIISAVLLITFVLAGCGGREIKPAATSTTTAVVSTAASISLSSTAIQVKSDNSDLATVTATVLDANNGALPAQALTISTTAGQLSTSTATTDATGKATFTFSGGATGTNNTATITVSANGSGATTNLPMQITGSTLSLTSTLGSVTAGTPLVISVSAKDAGAKGVAGQTLRYTIAATSTGSGTLSAATGTTDAAGAAAVSLTGTAAGTLDLFVEWLNAANAVTASATKSITVAGAATGSFSIAAPATSPFAVAIGVNQNVVVNVPATIGTAAVASIRYATTLGTWLTNGSSVLTVARATATDTQTFIPGASAGNASVQVDALDAAGAIISSASFTFSISAPSSAATAIILQSNVSVLAPSAGTNLSSATFTAIVKDAIGNPVGGANVLFSLIKSTGTGETISPVIATTGSNGQAQTTYTAGTSPTTQGAGVQAAVLLTPPAIPPTPAFAPITVGGQATSVSLGASTVISTNAANTAYILPVTVIVSDSSGARVAGAIVSLSLWPVNYYKGVRDGFCKAVFSAPYINEDINSNVTLDPGEDVDGPGGFISFVAPNGQANPPILGSVISTRGLPDGALWPAPSAAGTIPSTVTTGADGTATFDWVYLKQYADWIDARIRATLQVQGSQATTNLILNLTPSKADIVVNCSLPGSPYN